MLKVIILAGGLPSTLIEEDEKMPKPMAEIGGRPMLWHIMKQYAHYGYHDFVICTGYKGEVIKEYFMNFYIYQSDITVDLQTNEVTVHRKQTEDWNVSIIDTGFNSSVGERVHMATEFIGNEPVLVTYGDCLSNIDVKKMVEYHKTKGGVATFAVAHPAGRYEIVPLSESDGRMIEHPGVSNSWVNACSMVLEPEAFRYFALDHAHKPISLVECLAQEKNIQAYRHEGFWTPVETVRDKMVMEALWAEKRAPWKVWED